MQKINAFSSLALENIHTQEENRKQLVHSNMENIPFAWRQWAVDCVLFWFSVKATPGQ